jgi:hypothetical protein
LFAEIAAEPSWDETVAPTFAASVIKDRLVTNSSALAFAPSSATFAELIASCV